MNVGAMTFAGDVLLMVAILFGLVVVGITFFNSRKLKGEIFEKFFIYFSIGMLFVVVSLVAVTFLQGLFTDSVISFIHDICFIIGFAFMLFASIKITNYLSSIEKVIKKAQKKIKK